MPLVAPRPGREPDLRVARVRLFEPIFLRMALTSALTVGSPA